MTANGSKFYLSCLNKVVDQYNNTYHYSLNKNPINVNYSALPEKLRRILNLLNLTWKIES